MGKNMGEHTLRGHKTLPFLAHVRGSQGEFATPLTHAFAPSVFIENS